MVVVVVKSGSVNICPPSSSFHYTTASHLYMRYYTASLRNSAEWRKKLFVKKSNECGSDAKVNSCQEEKGEKGEKGETERKNETLALNQKVTTNNENILSVFLDVHKVINTLSTHLEKIQVVERKEKMIDKKKGDIIYQTRDGRVLHAFHSCEQGKIIWEDIVYDDLKAWLAAASIEAPYRCYD